MGKRPTRRHRRLTVRVTVDYADASGPCREIATTLGAGGLFIETETPASRGSVLKLCFRLAEGGAAHEIEGRVVWSRRPCDVGSYSAGMGISFTDRIAAARLARELESL